jgi:hypothetical protein
MLANRYLRVSAVSKLKTLTMAYVTLAGMKDMKQVSNVR